MCFCVYEVRTNTAEHGPLIPVIKSFSINSVQLSLSIDSGLVDNKLYSANITTTNTDGMEITVGTVEFSKSLSKGYECTNVYTLYKQCHVMLTHSCVI